MFRIWTQIRGVLPLSQCPPSGRIEKTVAKIKHMPEKLPPIHPGEILREDYLKPLGLTMNQLALGLRVPVTRISEIVHERRSITADTAVRLGRYFKTTPRFWLNLQTAYDLEVVEDQILARIENEVRSLGTASR
jgi:addiction module HigA family antidote